MSTKLLSGLVSAAFLAGTIAVAAQEPAQKAADQKSDAQMVTVTGCVQKETDVLKTAAAKPGMGDEFVITMSSISRGAVTVEPPATEPKPEGTSGTANFGRVYRVTGDKESDLKSYVGKRVEITGSFKRDTDAKMLPPPATAELRADNTPEITIESIKPAASGTCPAAVK